MNVPAADYHRLARSQASQSRCVRRQVGAVVSDKYGHVLSTGYNDAFDGKRFCDLGDCPRGLMSLVECPPYTDFSNCIAVHAEVRALTGVDRPHSGHLTLWVTDKPCLDCARFIEEWSWSNDIYLVTKWPVPIA